MRPHAPLGGASVARLVELRSHFSALVLLYEPALALLVQARPGAGLDDVLEAAGHVQSLDSDCATAAS